VLATVATSDGSAPRGLGARLAIAGPQEWVGALSGGCTEAAVIAEAERLLAEGDPDAAVLVSYAKETMSDVGPVCGATLGVLVERVDDVLVGTLERLVDTAAEGVASHLHVGYSWEVHAAADADLAPGGSIALVREDVALERLDDPASQAVELSLGVAGGELRQQVPGAPHLVLGGAGDIARELVLLADRLAWRTTLIDARTTVLEQTLRSCTPTRSVEAWAERSWDELGVDSRTACIALAHESHHDEPFLALALQSPAVYVGAVGSRRVQAARREALAVRGLDVSQIDRLHGPAGLDLGGGSAAEIALAIAAEVVATFHSRDGAPLVASSGPIRAT